jgi:hypothetical protein
VRHRPARARRADRSGRRESGRPGTVADSASFQEGLANVEAVVRSARAFVYETWNDAWATLARGDKLSVRQNTLIRLALAHATVVGARSHGVRVQGRRTAALRAGTIQHLSATCTQGRSTSRPRRRFTRHRRELGGLAKGKKWLFLNLVDGSAALHAAARARGGVSLALLGAMACTSACAVAREPPSELKRLVAANRILANEVSSMRSATSACAIRVSRAIWLSRSRSPAWSRSTISWSSRSTARRSTRAAARLTVSA